MVRLGLAKHFKDFEQMLLTKHKIMFIYLFIYLSGYQSKTSLGEKH